MVYSLEDLQGKNLVTLRDLARGLKLDPIGKNIADLQNMIVKASAANGRANGANGKAKATAVDDDDEGEVEEKPKARRGRPPKVKAAAPEETEVVEEASQAYEELKALLEANTAKINTIASILTQLAKAVGEEGLLPKGFGVQAIEGSAKPPKESKATAKKAKAVEVEEPEEPEIDDEPLALTEEELQEMDLAGLKAVVKKIHLDEDVMSNAGKARIDYDTTNERQLRKRIIEFLQKFGAQDDEEAPPPEAPEEEDEEEVEVAPKPAAKKASRTSKKKVLPEHIFEGAEVEADFGEDNEEDWVKGVVEAIDEDAGTATLTLEDDTEGDAPWECIRAVQQKAARKPKSR